MKSIDRRNYLYLYFVTLLGTFLRFYRLGFQCFWTEEAYTWDMIIKTPSEIWVSVLQQDFNPPLFYLLEHVLAVMLGLSREVLRYIPAVAGVLTIPVVFFIGKEVKDEETGLISAAILSVFGFHIYYSQFARAYSLALLFFALELLFFLKYRKCKNAKNAGLFGFFFVLSIWTHFFSLVPSVVLWAIFFYEPKPKGWQFVTSNVLLFSALPLLLQIQHFFTSRTELTYGLSSFKLLVVGPYEFLGEFGPYFLVIVGMGLLLSFKLQGRGFAMLSAGITMGTIGVGVLLAPYTPIFARYFIYVLPFILIFIGNIFIVLFQLLEAKLGQPIPLPIKIAVVLLITSLTQYSVLSNHFFVQRYSECFM